MITESPPLPQSPTFLESVNQSTKFHCQVKECLCQIAPAEIKIKNQGQKSQRGRRETEEREGGGRSGVRIVEQKFSFWTLCVSRNPRPKNRPAGTQGTCTVRTMGNEVLRNFLTMSGEAPAQSHRQSPLNSQGIPVECKPVVLQMAVEPQANLPTGRLFLSPRTHKGV